MKGSVLSNLSRRAVATNSRPAYRAILGRWLVLAAVPVAVFAVAAPAAYADDPGCADPRTVPVACEEADGGEVFPGEFNCYKGAALGAVGGAAAKSPAAAAGGAVAGCVGSYVN